MTLSDVELDSALAESNNNFARLMASKNQVAPGDPMPFSCRGCGRLCCVDQDILTMPPEAWRINWSLARQGLGDLIPYWGDTFPGGSSGVPVRMIRFVGPGGRGHCLCPFSLPAPRRQGADASKLLLRCQVREARPNACRIYPLGRIGCTDPDTRTVSFAGYRVMAGDCPGWAPAGRGKLVLAGYAPAPEGQTVADWVRAQIPDWVDEERDAYLAVLDELTARRLHAPTGDNPDGKLSEHLAVYLMGPLLYIEPPVPEDPADDHRVVMGNLATLVDRVSATVERLHCSPELPAWMPPPLGVGRKGGRRGAPIPFPMKRLQGQNICAIMDSAP